jgi:hypothetical protein
LIRRSSRHLHHCASTNVSTALALNSSYHRSSSPAVRIVEGLALRAGTFCRSVRGLSPEDIVDWTHEVSRSVCGLRSKSSHNHQLYSRGCRNVSPVELTCLWPEDHSRHLHNCASTNVSTALALNSSDQRSSSPAVRIVEGLALRAGTFCRSVRGLSLEDSLIGHTKCADPYVASIANRPTTSA